MTLRFNFSVGLAQRPNLDSQGSAKRELPNGRAQYPAEFNSTHAQVGPFWVNCCPWLGHPAQLLGEELAYPSGMYPGLPTFATFTHLEKRTDCRHSRMEGRATGGLAIVWCFLCYMSYGHNIPRAPPPLSIHEVYAVICSWKENATSPELVGSPINILMKAGIEFASE